MTSDRRLALALLAGGGALALLAYGQTWVRVVDVVAGLPASERTLSGRDLEPGAGFLPLLLLAAVLAVWATGGLLRRVVGTVAALAGLAVAVAAVRAGPLLDPARLDTSGDHVTSPWWAVAALAGLAAAAGAVIVVVRGGRWSAMAARYQRPARGDVTRARTAWELLDAGVDPTEVPPTKVPPTEVPPAEVPPAVGAPPAVEGSSGTMRKDEPTRARDTPGEDR